MVFTTRRQIGNAVRLVGRSPIDYAQELQEWLEQLQRQAQGGIPAGFNNTTPNATAAAGSAGTEAAGWMAADAIIPQGIVTTKGDLLGYSSVPDRLPIDLDGYVPVADSTAPLGIRWKPLPPQIPGPEGPQGEEGPPGIGGGSGGGAAGAPGADGAPGAIGQQGPPGYPGEDGVGEVGPPGSVGATGATGSAGAAGAPGPPWFAEDGAEGPPGPPGYSGVDGAAGTPGAVGAIGQMGPPGIGEDGAEGMMGPPGPQGPAGADGAPGSGGSSIVPPGDLEDRSGISSFDWFPTPIPPPQDPLRGSYAPDSFTILTGQFGLIVRELALTGTRRAILEGTARLTISD